MSWTQYFKILARLSCLMTAVLAIVSARAIQEPATPELLNFDKRMERSAARKAADKVFRQLPGTRIELDPISGSPRQIVAEHGFLTGPEGRGKRLSAKSLDAFAIDDPLR